MVLAPVGDLGSTPMRVGAVGPFIYSVCVSLVCVPRKHGLLFRGVCSDTREGVCLPFCSQMGSPETPKLGTRTWLRPEGTGMERQGNFLCWVKVGYVQDEGRVGAGKGQGQERGGREQLTPK